MAGDADGELDRSAAFLCLGGGNDLFDGRRMSGDDDLPGGVFDREGHGMVFAVNPPAQLLHHFSRKAEDGRHRPFAHGNGLLMVLCPQVNQSKDVAQIDSAGRIKGGIFSETVARHDDRRCGSPVRKKPARRRYPP